VRSAAIICATHGCGMVLCCLRDHSTCTVFHDVMVRTQIQMTEEQHAALRAVAASTGRSMADLVREGIEHVIAERRPKRRHELVSRALRLAGRFASGSADGSAHHDRHLAGVRLARRLLLRHPFPPAGIRGTARYMLILNARALRERLTD
jgi:hypothetical protein